MDNKIDWCKIKICSYDERRKLLPYIDELVELKHDIEKDGVLGLESYSKSSPDMFEKVASTFIVQGYMPDLCRTMLYNLLSSSEFEPPTYLKYVIFAEFVLMIQIGETSDSMIRTILSSYLGIACADIFLK
jgi:flagellar motor component MotA